MIESYQGEYMNKIKELSLSAIVIGITVGIVMTAANVYLGLYAGMTVSASIPAAVIGMGVYKMLFNRKSIHEVNIIQTMASAGESLAAGIIFTLPALVIIGAWNNFEFWPTTLIAIAGGLLGIIFMIPLRKVLIIEDKTLTYPEGVACAAVLKAGNTEGDDGGSFKTIIAGVVFGGVIKFLSSALALVSGSIEWATSLSKKIFFFGSDVSPALVAVGYIVKLEVAFLVLLGGVIGWVIGIPLLGTPLGMEESSALDIAWSLWSGQIRYIGVGAMIVGGLWSIVSVRKGISKGLGEMVKTYQNKSEATVKREDQDISIGLMLGVFIVCLGLMFGLYYYLIGSVGVTILSTLLMFIASFIFVAVSSYIVGLVGSSNNPVSGMTISALLGTAIFFLVMGFQGESAILATLGVAAVVCCAACTAGDCSQDLKTGSLIGATPKYQQMAQMIGVIIPAFVIAPVLTLLHNAYGIGDGLKAPQATLFASITKAIFGAGELPYNMIAIGAVLGILVLFIDKFFCEKRGKTRLHLMPIAVGIYLPVTLAVPMFLGGLIRYFKDKRDGESELEAHDGGVLVSSGIIAGEAIMGIGIAVLLTLGINFSVDITAMVKELLSIGALVLSVWFVYRFARKK